MSAGLAGCGSGSKAGTTQTEGKGGGETTKTGTPTEQKLLRGGKPIAAGSEPVQSMNIIDTTQGAGFDAAELVFTNGAKPHPETGRPVPWGFESWEIKPENVGTSAPTITATVRDGLSFHDGKKVTAEDAAFTYQYMMEQQTAGTYTPRPEVESVEVDKDKGSKVNFYLKEKTAAWNSDLLVYPFLPKHIWKNVPNYDKYSPRKESEGVVGSSPLKLKDFNWPNWIEWEMRPSEEIPFNEAEEFDWLHPEGPFIDGWRYELFQSRSAVFQALTDGKVHMTTDGVTLNRGVTAQKKSNLSVKQSVDSDFAFHAWNMRRVPFDDIAFRQFLTKALNQKWLIEKNFKGIGANKGTYSTSTMYKDWRPPEPSKIDEYEGIDIPDLDWPSDSTKYGANTRQEDIDALRSFLIDHPEAKHDYSLGKAKSKQVTSPDGKAIYINGKPITEVHTNNKGEPGQGPLEMSMGPPESDPLTFPRADNWVTTLNRIGIPVERSIEPWQTQYPKIYIKEEFDMYEQDWGNTIVWPQTHLEWQFHSSWADLEQGTDDDGKAQWNSMTYSGADDLIEQSMGMMDHEKRKPGVKKAFAKIYRDCPEMVTSTYNNLLPVSKQFTGYVVSNVDMVSRSVDTPLNIRKNPNYQS